MAGILKATTGLTGLTVSKSPHQTLRTLYERTLKLLTLMPGDAAYRQSTEHIVKTRLTHVNEESDVSKLEAKIDCGQVEELVLQANRELTLAREMLKWKPWEPLVEEAPKDQWKWPM